MVLDPPEPFEEVRDGWWQDETDKEWYVVKYVAHLALECTMKQAADAIKQGVSDGTVRTITKRNEHNGRWFTAYNLFDLSELL
jgi:hypothetical protein